MGWEGDFPYQIVNQGGGLKQMPWNLLGGFVGSTFDPAVGSGNFIHNRGSTYAAAVVTDTLTPFTKLRFGLGSPQGGTGSIFVVADSAGNHLAQATNADTQLSQVSSDYYDMTLSATVTPASIQQVMYVLFLYPPGTITTAPGIVVANGGNVIGIPPPSPVSFISWGNNNHAADTTIPDPFDLTSLSNTAGFYPYFSFKP